MSTALTQEIVLPSKGIFNPELPEGKVTQRCMMVSDQKFLAGSSQGADSAINQLLQRTITAPDTFDLKALTLPDTLYLLFKLRILSYGEKYSFRARCPECGKKITISLDLSELSVDTLEDNYQDSLVVTLPHRGDKVYTKVLTNQDIEDISKESKRRKKRRPDDDSDYILRIVKSIEKIVLKTATKEGTKEITDFFEIERYVESLTDLDASTIIAARDSLRYGIVPTVDYVCPECGEEIEVGLQFSSEFFRPTISI